MHVNVFEQVILLHDIDIELIKIDTTLRGTAASPSTRTRLLKKREEIAAQREYIAPGGMESNHPHPCPDER